MSLQPEAQHILTDTGAVLGRQQAILMDMPFPATELHVRWAISVAMDKLTAFHIAPDFQFTVEIVLAELLNNIVEHSYPRDNSGDVHLKILIKDDRIEIVTSDQGVPMPDLRPPCAKEPNLNVGRQDLPEGHFGWFMIRKLCADMTYQRNGSENQLMLAILQ